MRGLALLSIALALAAGTTACSTSGDAVNPGAVAVGPNGIAPLGLAPVRGWLSPDLKPTTSLLYVSDASDDLGDVFSVPGDKLKGQITDGIADPEGLAIDQKGKLYVSNY